MASLVVSGDTSGAITLSAPSVAGTNTLSLPAQTATLATLTTPSFATTIGVGGATAAASGAGITFPASQSASSDANTLDDYEEGTWTPTYYGSSTAGTLTGSVYGYYTKIGRQVTLVGRLDNVTLTGASGNFTIGGLPFTIANLTRNEGSGAFSFYNVNFNTSYLYSLTGTPNQTYIEILGSVDGSPWANLPVDNASSIYMNFTFTYFA